MLIHGRMKLKNFRKILFWIYFLFFVVIVSTTQFWYKFFIGVIVAFLLSYLLTLITYKLFEIIKKERFNLLKILFYIFIIFLILIYLFLGMYILSELPSFIPTVSI